MQHDFEKIIDRKNTNCLKWDCTDRIFGDPDVLPMWVADMDFESPLAVRDEIIRRTRHGIFGYTVKSDGYYESIIKWLDKKHNWHVERDWIVGTPGVVPSLSFSILAYTDPGDSILIQPPVYYPFFSIIKDNKRKLVINELILENGLYTIDFEDLEKKLKSEVKMMIFCSPHNPGGRVWTKDEVSLVSKMCIENNVILVSDEIHSDIVFSGYTHTPAASISIDTSQNTITTLAPSKTFNIAGLAVSYCIIPNAKHRLRFKEVIQSMGGDIANIYGDIALEAAYNHGETWLDTLLCYLEENIKTVSSFIDSNIPGIRAVKSQGTYLLWLDCSSLGLKSKELVTHLAKMSKIGLSAGSVFGPGGEGFLRMNVACPKPILLEGLNRLKEGISKL